MSFSLATANAAIVATLTPLLTPVTVIPHGGLFTEKELALLLGKAPCVLVGASAVGDFAPTEDGFFSAAVEWTATCLAVDGAQSRADAAKDMAQTVANAVLADAGGQLWGDPTAFVEPDLTSLRLDNLYNGHVNILSVAVWAVGWRQSIVFSIP